MWVLPFLYYYHAYPLTTFYQEWGAGVLGLCASAYLLHKQFWLQPAVPRIALLPVLLILLSLLQYALGLTVYFAQTLLFTLYMLWISQLMILGYALRENLGWPLMATWLAVFLLAGAELNALMGVLQHYRWHTFLDAVVTSKNGIPVYGNLAQPNHYANYIALGLVSLGLLQQKLRSWQVVLLALPLLFVLVLSGSRSSWFYIVGMIVLAYLLQRRDHACRHVLHYTLLLLLGFALMHWIVQLPWLTGASGMVTPLQRMMSSDTSGSGRLYLWHEALLIFSQFPLLGAGLGQFAWQHFLWAPELQANYINGLYNNAHNVVLHLAAEMGLTGVLIFVGSLGLWFWQVLRTKMTLHHWWGCAVLAVIGIHGMLEYPLWYAYFLGVAAILLGALDYTRYQLEFNRLGRLSILAVLVLGLMSMVQWQQGYQKLEQALVQHTRATDDKAASQRQRNELSGLYGIVLLQPYVEFFLSNWTDLSAGNLGENIALNENTMRFIPVSHGVYQQATLLAMSNRFAEAKVQISRAIWSYPGDFPAKQKELNELALKDPAHFAALLEFAIEKYKEYLNAVSAI